MTEVARVLGNNGKYWLLDIGYQYQQRQKELTDNDSGRQGVGNRGSERFRELRMTQDPFPEGRLASPTTKTDEFSEKFQTVFAPPPHFRKIMLQICINVMLKKPCFKVQNLQDIFLD